MRERLVKEGKAKHQEADGTKTFTIENAAFEELIRDGYLLTNPNLVENFAREAIPYLADKIDEDGGTTLIYWACGTDGSAIEVVGDLTGEEAKDAQYPGPKAWGAGTELLPAVKYFLERFDDAEWGIYLFITDGRLDDLEELCLESSCMQYVE